MRVINISLSELETKMLMIGFEGENQITQVRIDAAEILTDHPNATPTLIVKPLFGFAYPVIVAMEGTDIVWEIDNSVLSFHGDGEIQLTFTEGTVIAKSYVGRIRIKRSLAVTGEAPDPIETWEQAATAKLAEVDAQIGELEDMVEAAEAAKDAAQEIVDDSAADIQAAGATQVQVVQAAGEEVLESIPSDYTELSDDVSGLKSALSEIAFVRENVSAFVDEKFIATNADVGDIVSLTPTFSADWEYLIVDCVQGDRFYVDETGASTARAWAFIDSNNVMLAKSESGLIKDIIIAPQNTAKVIFNNKKTAYTKSVYKVIGDNKAEEAYTKVDELGIEHFNLYTGINNTLNCYVNSSNGALSSNSSFQTSDFINVSAYQNQTIKVSYSFSGAFYDSSKTFVASSGFGRSDESYSDLDLTVPATAKYVRVSVSNTKTDKLQVGKNVSRQNYMPYANYSLDDLVVEFSQIKGTEGLFVNNNLFDSNAITTGKFISGTTGNPNTLSGYNASDFIDIGASNYVTVSGAWNAVVFKADKSYSRQITRRYSDYPLTALLTSAEKYIRITVKDANLTKAKVEVNMGESVFVDYGLALDSAKQVDSAYKMTTVYIGTDCYFTTINDALTAITDNSIKNRYTLFITEGEYNETITTKDYVDIVGESKYKSIINYISDDESDYVNRSAIFASTYTTLKNLTVKTTGSKYPLHCDARYNEPYEVKAVNCIFQHDGFTGETQPAGTAVGIGLYWGQHVSLEQCECIASGATGVASVYCHNSSENDASHSRFRSLFIKNCILSNATYGLRLQAIENNQLQANECVYIGNKNTASTPVSLEANSYQSWHILSIGNEPSYTQE